MKKLLFATLCISLLSEGFAQTDSLSRKTTSSGFSHKTVDIELSSPEKTETLPGHFNHFDIIDARPDTSFIGVHTETLWLPMTRMRPLALKGTVNHAIPEYLNNNFTDPEAPYKVLVVIRKLWISDVTYSYRQEEQKDEIYLRDSKINCRLRAEVYVSRDDKPYYTPVLRYDSLLVLDKLGYNGVGSALSGLLQNLADTLAGTDIDKKWETGRQLTLVDIGRFNSSLFDFPVFRDRTLVKGVYANFDEFRNNAPSIREYELGSEKKRSVLYTKDPAGHSYYNHNAWGVCDGKNLYVMLEGYIFPIFREQNAFYLSGFVETKANQEELKEEREERADAGQLTPANEIQPVHTYNQATLTQLDFTIKYNKNAMKRQTRVFAIDPDTGIIY